MKVVKAVSFLTLLAIALTVVNNIVMYKTPYGITQYKGFYEQEENSVDLLFVGTSHVYSDIDPAYVYDETGILSYDLATGGASISASYYSIEQALEYQRPTVIAVELFGIVQNGLSQRELVDATYEIRNPRIKYALLKENIGDNSILEFYMAFPWYHSLYNDVTKNDFFGHEHIQNVGTTTYLYPAGKLQVYKGTTILSYTTPLTSPEIFEIEYESVIDEKAEMYLNRIIKLCKEKNIKLCFVVSPFSGVSENFCAQINYIEANIASPNEIHLIDANKHTQEIGINWNTDAAEWSHLNYKGVEKYSRWLSRKLADLYELRDCHGTSVSASWEQNLKWEKEVYLAFDLLENNELKNTINIWKKLDADIFISFNGEQWEDYKKKFLLLTGLTEDEGKKIDGVIMEKGTWKAHYCNEPEIIIENGIDTVSISSSEQGGIINYNGKRFVKATNGINIVVYDKYIGDVIDNAVITDINEFKIGR